MLYYNMNIFVWFSLRSGHDGAWFQTLQNRWKFNRGAVEKTVNTNRPINNLSIICRSKCYRRKCNWCWRAQQQRTHDVIFELVRTTWLKLANQQHISDAIRAWTWITNGARIVSKFASRDQLVINWALCCCCCCYIWFQFKWWITRCYTTADVCRSINYSLRVLLCKRL
jgi:hypothetical protein